MQRLLLLYPSQEKPIKKPRKKKKNEEGSIEVEGNRGVGGGEDGNNKAEDNRLS